MTLAIVWRSGRVSLVDISDINHIIDQGSVVLPGNPVCVKVVNTASGWTAYCGQNNGYLSVINISTTSMVKVIDIKLPNVDGDVSLDLSIDNNLIYAISNQDCTDSTMFVLDAQNLSAQPYLRNIPNFCMKVLYQLGSINLLYTVKSLTPSPSNPNTVEIATWDVDGKPPRQLSLNQFNIPFTNDSKTMAKSFNGFQDSLIYICNASTHTIAVIEGTASNPINLLPILTLPDKITAIAPVSYNGKAYVSAGANLCIVDKDKGVIQTIPLTSSAKAIDVSSDSSAAYLLLSGGFNDNVYKVDFKRQNIITQGRLPWLNPTGFTLIPPANPQTRNVSSSGCSCKKKKKK